MIVPPNDTALVRLVLGLPDAVGAMHLHSVLGTRDLHHHVLAEQVLVEDALQLDDAFDFRTARGVVRQLVDDRNDLKWQIDVLRDTVPIGVGVGVVLGLLLGLLLGLYLCCICVVRL